jgi:uncharacterized membrane protein
LAACHRAIAWIGSSFYFVWLDNHLTAPSDPQLKAQGVGGELWAVHGGGFYNPQKYLGAPPNCRNICTGFTGSLTAPGFGIQPVFAGIYFNARTYLIDPSVANLTPAVAIAAALGFLALGWLVYDLLCRLFGKNETVVSIDCRLRHRRRLGCLPFIFRTCRLSDYWRDDRDHHECERVFLDYSGTAQSRGGHEQGLRLTRCTVSAANNAAYTTPTLRCRSCLRCCPNHYSMTYNHAQNWLVLVLIMVVGVLVRQFFILRHKGKPAPFIRCWRSSSSLRWLRGWHQNPRLSAAQKNHRQRSLPRFSKSYKHAAYNVMQNIRH